MILLFLVLLYVSFTFGCPTTTTTTTSTTIPTPTPKPIIFHKLFTFSHMKYTACMDCKIININLTALINEKYFKMNLPNYAFKYKYIEKVSTLSIKGTYLSTFNFFNETGNYEEMTFLYSSTAVFGTLSYYIRGSNNMKSVIVTIRQLHRLVTIIEEKYTNFIPKSHQYKTLKGEYGFKFTDDTMSRMFSIMNKKIPKGQRKLFMKGSNDHKTRATVSVTIKYTTEFALYLSVHPKYGMYLLSAHAIKVSVSLV